MNLIVLAGNSIENQPWAEDVKKLFEPYFSSVSIQEYKHWKSDESLLNIDLEVESLKDLAIDCDEYIVFAKSAGSLVTAKAIQMGKISPAKCIFVGIPFDWARTNNFAAEEWLTAITQPTLVIQHSEDPFASARQVSEFIGEIQSDNFVLKEIPGDTHEYREYESIEKMVVDFAGLSNKN